MDLNPGVQPWSLGSYSYTALQATCRDTGTLCAEPSPPQDDRETDHVGSYNSLALSLSGALGLGSISLTFLQGCFLLTLLRPSLSPLSKGYPSPGCPGFHSIYFLQSWSHWGFHGYALSVVLVTLSLFFLPRLNPTIQNRVRAPERLNKQVNAKKSEIWAHTDTMREVVKGVSGGKDS